MAEDFKFEVGATYENMKGPYEVISIRRNEMVIRWENGTEIETTVDLQKRIIERMAFEEESKQRDAQKKAPGGKKKKGGQK
ncbi:MAG: hypothetical protein P8010_20345 [Desulfosarcinaceae bacterium]